MTMWRERCERELEIDVLPTCVYTICMYHLCVLVHVQASEKKKYIHTYISKTWTGYSNMIFTFTTTVSNHNINKVKGIP